MAKIIGIRPSSFKGDQGEMVTGKNIYVSYPLDKGEGLGADRFFVTDKKMADWFYVPAVGDEIRLEYNRFGKVSGMSLITE